MLTHSVQRPFRGDEPGKYLTGQLVDALGWRWTLKLVDQRYIAPIPPGLQAVQSTDGRWWADRAFLGRYGLQEQRPAGEPPIATEPEPAVTEPEVLPDKPVVEWPQHAKGNWWTLSDGSKVQGEAKARAAQTALG